MPFTRPNLPYANVSLPNDDRFRVLTRALNAPPTDIMLDSELNFVADSLNILEQQIAAVPAGAIPGSSDPNNANFILSTNGAGQTPWVLISDINIAPVSINANKLIPSSVTNIQIQPGTILGSNISNGAITTSKLNDLSVTNDKIALNTIIGNRLSNLTIVGAKIAPLTITGDKITNITIDASTKLIDLSIPTIKIADLAITTPKIATGAITTVKIANAAVTNAEIAPLTITAARIALNTITSNQINPSFAATKAQQQAANSSTVYTNPAVQQFHPSAASFWCYFDGSLTGTNAPKAGFNVISVTRTGVGKYTINYIVPFTTSNYCVIGTSGSSTFDSLFLSVSVLNTNSCNVYAHAGGPFADAEIISVVGFGVQ